MGLFTFGASATGGGLTHDGAANTSVSSVGLSKNIEFGASFDAAVLRDAAALTSLISIGNHNGFPGFEKVRLDVVPNAGSAWTEIRLNIGDGTGTPISVIWASFPWATLPANGTRVRVYARWKDNGTVADYELVLMQSDGTLIPGAIFAGVGTESPTDTFVNTTTQPGDAGANGVLDHTDYGVITFANGQDTAGGMVSAAGQWDYGWLRINAATPLSGASRAAIPSASDNDLAAFWTGNDASKPTGAGPHADAMANVATGTSSAGTSADLTLRDVTAWVVGGDDTGGGSAPTIAFDDATKDFSATAGGANPANQTVNISNSGTGTLDGLEVGTIIYS